jgi:hypothetical protein
MSKERFGKATRRAFLGTATAATAATLTAPVGGEAQAADTSPPRPITDSRSSRRSNRDAKT